MARSIISISPAIKTIYEDLTGFIDYAVRPTYETGSANTPKIMYPILIESRFEARRSWTEFWEIALRDPLGALSWLWGVPFGQKWYLAKFTPKAIQDLLFVKPPTVPLGKRPSVFRRLSVALQNSPMSWEMQSSAALKHRIEQLKQLSRQLPQGHMLAKAIKAMEQAKIQRDFATFAGFMVTFLVLGVAINIFNIYHTKKTVAEQKARLQALG